MIDLSEQEKEKIIKCIQEGQPLPSEYRWRLFNHPLEAELIWPGKNNDFCKADLPFQTIEHIDAPRLNTAEYSVYAEGWTNKLIWGENRLVLASLQGGPLKNEIERTGGIKLVYIDPPFDVGADFSMPIEIGDGETYTKRPSVIEEVAYRDTWGRGIDSYLNMIYERLALIRNLMSDDGSVYVHCDYRLSSTMRLVMDDVFGKACFVNQIIWQGNTGDTSDKNRKFIKSHDTLFLYSVNPNERIWNDVFQDYGEGGRSQYKYSDEKGLYRLNDISNPGGGGYIYDLGYGEKRPQRGYCMPIETARRWISEGILVIEPGKVPARKKYINEKGFRCKDVWSDISGSIRKEYPTQKPEPLLERIIIASSNPGDIVADFFSGSGTTMAVAEKLGRKWIGCDLSRFAIHTSRKRLIQVQRQLHQENKDYHPFEILNLGHYDRQFYIGIDHTLPKKERERQAREKENAFYNLINKAYHAIPLLNMPPFQAFKGNTAIYIGSVDAPITMIDIEDIIRAAQKYGYANVDALGFEFEMGLSRFIQDEAKAQGINLSLRYIPKDVFDKRVVDKGQVVFYDVAYLEAQPTISDKSVSISLTDFGVFYRQEDTETIVHSLKVGASKVIVDQGILKKLVKERNGEITLHTLTNHWTDWIDYWSVDFDYESLKDPHMNNFVFENQWQTFRTKKNRKLELKSTPYAYPKSGKYKVAIKVVDIFGHDTTKVIEVII